MDVRSEQLWPIKAREILESKGLTEKELRMAYNKIIFPQDPEYGNERTQYTLLIEIRPLFILVASSTDELESILNLCKNYELTIKIMNGRHSTQITDCQVLVDMRLLDEIIVKKESIIVGGGSTQGSANKVLFDSHDSVKSHDSHDSHDSVKSRGTNDMGKKYCHFGNPDHSHFHTQNDVEAFPGGTAASVGCAGISTIGGVGALVRWAGLTIQSVESFKITLPPTSEKESYTTTVNKDSHSKLFWALLGGGANNFGIVSEIKLKILNVPKILKYTLKWDWSYEKAINILDLYKINSLNRPYRYNEELSIYKDSDGCHISLGGYYVTKNKDTNKVCDLNKLKEKIRKEFGSFSPGTEVVIEEVEYDDLYKKRVEDRAYYNFSLIAAFFANNYDSSFLVNKIDDGLMENDEFHSISIQLLGGKVKDAEGSFYPKDYNFFIDYATFWNSQTKSVDKELWSTSISKRLLKNSKNVPYLGFPIPFADNTSYYGENYKKLSKIKHKYDPLNILTNCGTIY